MNLNLLKQKRKELNLSQQEMANFFNYTRQNYGAKENGVQNFKLSEIKQLKEILQLSNDDIVEIFL